MTITVLVVDDQVYVRDILRYLLEAAGDIQVVGLASNGREAVELAASSSPDVVVMDISMPVLDGIEASRQILANDPNARLVLVTLHNNANYIRSSIQAGALGYVLKDAVGNELVTAVRSVAKDHRYFSKTIEEVALHFLAETGNTDLISGVDDPLLT